MRSGFKRFCVTATVAVAALTVGAAHAQLPALRDRPLAAAERIQLARLETDLVRISTRERTSVAALRAVARALGPRLAAESPEALIGVIETRARQLSTLQRSLNEAQTRLDALDSRRVAASVEPRLREAQEAVEAGELERADTALAGVAEAFRTARQTQQAQLNELGRGEAAALGERARLALTVGEFERAAELAGQALAAVPATDTALRWRYSLDEAYARVNLGHRQRQPQVMAAQIDRIRNEVLPLAPRAERPLDWAETWMIIGASEACACMAELSAQRMPAALQALASAGEVITHESDPARWSQLQVYRGGTLTNLATLERSPARLTDAIAVYRGAAARLDRQAHPDQYFTLQALLGQTLWALHAAAPAGRGEALAAMRSALDAPLTARLRSAGRRGLASYLHYEAALSNDLAPLTEAATVARAALTDVSRDQQPLDWASTQDLLGQIMLLRAQIANDPAILTEAETAFRAARDAMDRQRNPAQWAQSNAGLAATMVRRVQAGQGVTGLDEADRMLRESSPLLNPRSQAAQVFGARRLLAHIDVLRAERGQDDADAAARAETSLREMLAQVSPQSPSRAEIESLMARAVAARGAQPS